MESTSCAHGSTRIVTERVPAQEMPDGVPALWVLGDTPHLFVGVEVPEDIVGHLLDVIEAS